MAVYEGSVVTMMKFSYKFRQIDASKLSSEYNKQLQSEIQKLMYDLNAHGHAHNVAHVLHQEIQTALSHHAVALLRCAVTMVNRVRGGVWSSFEHWLPYTMEGIYERFCENRDTVNKAHLVLLRNEWHYLFSGEMLKEIDDRLRQLDGNWPLFNYRGSPPIRPVPGKVLNTYPPMVFKPILPKRSPAHPSTSNSSPRVPSASHAHLAALNHNRPASPKVAAIKSSSPKLRSISPAHLAALNRNRPASPKVAAIKNSGRKERTKVSPKAQYQPLEFIKPPSSRQSTTETKLRVRRAGSSSDKENSADFYDQQGIDQSSAHGPY